MKKKPDYLHIEILSGRLCVYINNKPWDGNPTTFEQLNNECDLGDATKDQHHVFKFVMGNGIIYTKKSNMT